MQHADAKDFLFIGWEFAVPAHCPNLLGTRSLPAIIFPSPPSIRCSTEHLYMCRWRGWVWASVKCKPPHNWASFLTITILCSQIRQIPFTPPLVRSGIRPSKKPKWQGRAQKDSKGRWLSSSARCPPVPQIFSSSSLAAVSQTLKQLAMTFRKKWAKMLVFEGCDGCKGSWRQWHNWVNRLMSSWMPMTLSASFGWADTSHFSVLRKTGLTEANARVQSNSCSVWDSRLSYVPTYTRPSWYASCSFRPQKHTLSLLTDFSTYTKRSAVWFQVCWSTSPCLKSTRHWPPYLKTTTRISYAFTRQLWRYSPGPVSRVLSPRLFYQVLYSSALPVSFLSHGYMLFRQYIYGPFI